MNLLQRFLVCLVMFSAVFLGGCATTTTTGPDGTTTTTRQPDAKTVKVLGGVVSEIGAAAAKAAIDQFAEEQKRGAHGDPGKQADPKLLKVPFSTIDFRHERIVDPPSPELRPLIVTREGER